MEEMTYGTAGNGQGTLNTVNFVSSGTWYNVLTNQDPNLLTSSVSWNPNVTVNAYTSGSNDVQWNVNLSSGQSVTVGVTATNSCGSGNRNPTFTNYSGFRVAPNPAKDKVTVTFDHTDYLEALPEQIELVNEKTLKVVRSAITKDVFEAKAFRDGNAVEFDIKALARGIYYLRITDSRLSKDQQVKMVRLVFE